MKNIMACVNRWNSMTSLEKQMACPEDYRGWWDDMAEFIEEELAAEEEFYSEEEEYTAYTWFERGIHNLTRLIRNLVAERPRQATVDEVSAVRISETSGTATYRISNEDTDQGGANPRANGNIQVVFDFLSGKYAVTECDNPELEDLLDIAFRSTDLFRRFDKTEKIEERKAPEPSLKFELTEEEFRKIFTLTL